MKRKLALTLALIMGLSINTFGVNAFATDEPTPEEHVMEAASGSGVQTVEVEGKSVLQDAVVQVVLPTKLNFAIDPYQMKSADVVSGNYFYASRGYLIANAGNVHVSVIAEFSLTSTGASSIAHSRYAINKSNYNITTKQAFLAVVPLKTGSETISETETDNDAGVTSVSLGGLVAYDTTKFAELAPSSVATVATSPNAMIQFKLERAYDAYSTTAQAITSNGYAAFTFFGEVNPLATWEGGDLDVVAIFRILPVSPEVYENSQLIDAANMKGVVAIKSAAAAKTPVANPYRETAKYKMGVVGGTTTTPTYTGGVDGKWLISNASFTATTKITKVEFTYGETTKTLPKDGNPVAAGVVAAPMFTWAPTATGNGTFTLLKPSATNNHKIASVNTLGYFIPEADTDYVKILITFDNGTVACITQSNCN